MSQLPQFTPTSRVLLVEDNIMNQKLAIAMLKKMGLVPDIAVNGKKALALMETHRYDLVLMDCQMPVLNGYEATKAIREFEQGQEHRTPIIAVTANAMSNDKQKCIDAGMDDYVTKPFTLQTLATTIEEWMHSGNKSG